MAWCLHASFFWNLFSIENSFARVCQIINATLHIVPTILLQAIRYFFLPKNTIWFPPSYFLMQITEDIL